MKRKSVLFFICLMAIVVSAFFGCGNPSGENYDSKDEGVGNEEFEQSKYETSENEDGTLTFVRYSGTYDGEIFVIPETVDDKPVTAIAKYAFEGENNITEIKIPKTVKEIDSDACAGLTGLTTITFEGTGEVQLQKIRNGAFEGCRNLSKFNSAVNNTLEIPSSVTFVDANAFYGTAFSTVNIPSDTSYIGNSAFSDNENLTSISVAAGNTNYFSQDGVLYNKDGCLMQYPIGNTITSFSVPETVSDTKIRHILKGAFMGESDLTSITLNNIISIDEYAFKGCENLATVTNASDVEYIGLCAFDDTLIMDKKEDFITIGKVLYRYKGTDSVLEVSDFPAGLKRIGANAFIENDTLTEIYLPNNILDFDNNAFIDCSKLSKIVSLNGILPDIGENTFVNLPEEFRFYCRKSLIDNLKPSSNWYKQSDVLAPITTVAYFEDLDIYETFYFGEKVKVPKYDIEGIYNKGWLRVNEETGETFVNYLTPSEWLETIPTVTFRADLTYVSD